MAVAGLKPRLSLIIIAFFEICINVRRFQFELKEMQRRDMEEVERRALSGPSGDVRRGTLQRTSTAAAGERPAEAALPMERGPQTSDDFGDENLHDTTMSSCDSGTLLQKTRYIAERNSRLMASESSGWRLSLSRSARFDIHDLRGKKARIGYFYL